MGRVIHGDVEGTVSGMNNVINGNLWGNLSGMSNVVTKNVYGTVSGLNNIIKGKLYGSMSGMNNQILNQEPPAPPKDTLPTPHVSPATSAQRQDILLPAYTRGKDDEVPSGESESCGICMVNRKQCTNVPCGHYFMCLGCVYKLYEHHKTKNTAMTCSICNANVTQVVRIYH
eukprot:TRINITY_DN5635_c0_g1_i2.p1 TRINITY_DN5635_c0_g1~~TRINITY_DN5635_c0_g1_i2.p1  ORF type:complete len:196 (+),score=12.14 TRINITY_DN5635_c0_g1_i2:74-589(+)